MKSKNSSQQCDIGIIGLGVMGRNLLLNMSDHGFVVAGYDKDDQKVNAIKQQYQESGKYCSSDLQEFINFLKIPRAVLLLVPAGKIVDLVLADLLRYVAPGDLIIDAGNSFYKDTDLRYHSLSEKGIAFLGVGVSGGEVGARLGPSIMPGGTKEAYERISHILEAVAAKVNGEPCVTYLGPGSSGHYVKMVHNGIEYGVMELIAETYDLMKRGLGLNNDKLGEIYGEWNKGLLNSYLMEITSNIFHKVDDDTGMRLIDMILDVARQKGTGMWTSESAMDLQVPVPTIDLAVTMRDLSAYDEERRELSKVYDFTPHFNDEHKDFIGALRNALYVAIIITYTQGMSLLRKASKQYNYELSLEKVARIWRGGCIIRSAFLSDIQAAFHAQQDLPSLLLDHNIAQEVTRYHEDLRQVVCRGSKLGIAIPGLMVSLSYLDALRSQKLPANLIQAQRDYFGAHTYERTDKPGIFHTEWE